jgi:hypothetical protein
MVIEPKQKTMFPLPARILNFVTGGMESSFMWKPSTGKVFSKGK